MDTQELHVVFGATGGAGKAVVSELLARGKRVRAVSRRGASDLPTAVEVVRADAADAASAREAVQGAAVIYNCTNAPYTDWPRQFPPLWRNVTAAAAAVGARLVVMDNLYMYGQSAGPMKEDSPLLATTRKGLTRIKMAEEVLAAHSSGTVQVAIGRAADYFGPGVTLSTNSVASFRNALEGKSVQTIGKLDLLHTQAFINDVARGLVTLGEHPEAFGQVWHLPHAPAITQREFFQLLFAEAGTTPRIQAAPGFVVQLIGLAVPMMREIGELRYQYEKPFVVDSSKFERAFGVSATPLRQAIRITLDWVRAQPVSATAAAH